MDDEWFMRAALNEAQLAFQENEVPIGAVLVRHGEIIARDHNRKEQRNEPTAHAEIMLIQKAAPLFPSWRIENSTLYVTLEPCAMCAGAILQARIDRVVYGCTDLKAGAVNTLYQLLTDPRLNHRCEVTAGILENECRDLLHRFFVQQRQLGKK